MIPTVETKKTPLSVTAKVGRTFKFRLIFTSLYNCPDQTEKPKEEPVSIIMMRLEMGMVAPMVVRESSPSTLSTMNASVQL